MWRNCNPYILLVGMQDGLPAMENSTEIPQKIKDIIPTHDPAVSFLVFIPKDEIRILKK